MFDPVKAILDYSQRSDGTVDGQMQLWARVMRVYNILFLMPFISFCLFIGVYFVFKNSIVELSLLALTALFAVVVGGYHVYFEIFFYKNIRQGLGSVSGGKFNTFLSWDSFSGRSGPFPNFFFMRDLKPKKIIFILAVVASFLGAIYTGREMHNMLLAGILAGVVFILLLSFQIWMIVLGFSSENPFVGSE